MVPAKMQALSEPESKLTNLDTSSMETTILVETINNDIVVDCFIMAPILTGLFTSLDHFQQYLSGPSPT